MQAQQFSSQPAVVARQKYRDEEEVSPKNQSTNIMYDRRVVRGRRERMLITQGWARGALCVRRMSRGQKFWRWPARFNELFWSTRRRRGRDHLP